jgi:hypothetical protein
MFHDWSKIERIASLEIGFVSIINYYFLDVIILFPCT